MKTTMTTQLFAIDSTGRKFFVGDISTNGYRCIHLYCAGLGEDINQAWGSTFIYEGSDSTIDNLPRCISPGKIKIA